jgi:hypothetical protein
VVGRRHDHNRPAEAGKIALPDNVPEPVGEQRQETVAGQWPR